MQYLKRIMLVVVIAFINVILLYLPLQAINHPNDDQSGAHPLRRGYALEQIAPIAQRVAVTGTTSVTTATGLTSTVPLTVPVAVSVEVTPDLRIKCTVNVLRLNLRSGPGTQYDVLDTMARSSVFTATQRLVDGSWLLGNSLLATGWTATRLLDCTTDPIALRVATQPGQTDGQPAPTTNTATTAPAGATPTVAPAPAPTGAFKLLQPLAPTFSGRQTFQWQAGITLGPNQGFEVIFWEPGQTALGQGFGLAGITTESRAGVDLDKMSLLLPQLQLGKEYQWGVLLVQVRPYRRLQFLGGGQRFLFKTAQGNDPVNGDNDPVAPPKPPKPPPK